MFTTGMKSEYKLLLENTQEMIIFFDSKCRIIKWNEKAANELGYDDSDLCQTPVNNIFKNVFQYENNKFIVNDKYLKRPEETIAYRKNQTCFPVELKITLINKGRKFTGLCTAVNVTDKKNILRELKHLKSELESYCQMDNEIVANITHELRTPVNGIMGFSNILLDTELKPNQEEAVNIIRRCCNNMNSLINDLLDYAKISGNKMVIEEREFKFHEFITRIIDLNSVAVNEKGLKLLLDIPDDIPEVVIGDELRLGQILNNLFSNAIKFTPSGQVGLKVMKTSQTGQFLELFFMVFDTGIGIGKEQQDRLFKSFSQVDSSITRRFGGTGLGLSICKKLVEAMHGTIEVDSEKNKGSAFSFSVSLGLPKSAASADTDMEDGIDELEASNIEIEDTDMSDIDYINKVLMEAGSPDQNKTRGMDQMRDALAIMNDYTEKLTICIEMENWEKAEELAGNMKKLLPADHDVNSKNILRLLFELRKENHNAALAILNEIKENISEEK